MTLQEALNEAATRIARRDAQVLLGNMLKQDHAWLLAHANNALDEARYEEFTTLVNRRAEREPLQYLTGTQEFYGLPFRVTRDTLIPRPETEHLVEATLAWASTQPRALQLLDVGTGSGAIAIALAKNMPEANITSCDISSAALNVAEENARTNQVNVTFVKSDLLAAFATKISAGFRFDAIVSNPPYIPVGDAASMQPEVRDHEPHVALFAGEDGLAVYRRLIPEAHTALRDGGLLALEIGYGQKDALEALLKDWNDVHFIDDYAGISRVALAMKPNRASETRSE